MEELRGSLTDPAIIRSLIDDIADRIRPKMLVFGLAYDSELWWALSDRNVYFVEDNIDYIEAARVDPSRILQYDYCGITVESSFHLSNTELSHWQLPAGLLEKGPFDIILIQGPVSYNKMCPGRMLPLFWASRSLARNGSVIYVDDSRRPLEAHCIDRFFHDKAKQPIAARGGCMRIQM